MHAGRRRDSKLAAGSYVDTYMCVGAHGANRPEVEEGGTYDTIRSECGVACSVVFINFLA